LTARRALALLLILLLATVGCVALAVVGGMAAAGGPGAWMGPAATGVAALVPRAPRATASAPRPSAAAEPGALAATASPRSGGTLRMPFDQPSSLDPALVRDVPSAEYVYEVFSGLVTLSDSLDVVPDLAESWQVSPSGTVYTFTLLAAATFHDGTPVTASDVVYSIQRACSPAVASSVAETYLGDIVGCSQKLTGGVSAVEGASAPDDRHVVLRIDAPKAYFLAKLTYPTSFVVDRRQADRDPQWFTKPNGTGPFRMTGLENGKLLSLRRFDGWYRRPAYLDGVDLDLQPVDPLTRYENSELDLTPVGATDYDRVTDPLNPLHFEVLAGKADLSVTYLGLNTRVAPFDDPAVRQAVAQAIDRDRLTEIVLGGSAVPATTILPPGLPGHTADANPYRFDPALARASLAQSRYGGPSGLPALTLYVPGETGDSPVAEAVADYLGSALGGVPVAVEQAPWEEFQNELDRGTYGMYMLGWAADYPDPQDFLDVQFHSGSPLNDTRYSNPQVDRWLEEARVERAEARRFSLYAQAERQILADAPWVPVYGGAETWLVSPLVHGFTLPSVVRPRLADVWLSE
jgi:oligopeptide transport system substrate-binding protein